MNKILLSAVLLFFFSACRVSEPASPPENVRVPRPVSADFTVPLINGRSFSLSSFRGKVVLIDFWATWCGPCVYEIPGFINLKNKYGRDGFEIIGFSVDRDKAAAVNFARAKGMNYPVAFADAELQQKYGGIRAIPTTFLIDREGRIAEKIVGAHEESFFDKKIKDLLEG
ncbi:MAG: TlpA disulfide reductase family protein [Elusimicrobiota bacterium]|nr:TlpA disulfide reductase family protein [Elusimicrobiota bacterium]